MHNSICPLLTTVWGLSSVEAARGTRGPRRSPLLHLACTAYTAPTHSLQPAGLASIVALLSLCSPTPSYSVHSDCGAARRPLPRAYSTAIMHSTAPRSDTRRRVDNTSHQHKHRHSHSSHHHQPQHAHAHTQTRTTTGQHPAARHDTSTAHSTSSPLPHRHLTDADTSTARAESDTGVGCGVGSDEASIAGVERSTRFQTPGTTATATEQGARGG